MNQNNQKLRYPVNFVGITNGYSSEHQAIDLGWHDKQDEPIYACADGKVAKIWQDEQFGGGLTLTIEYNNGYKSDFKHLSKVLVSEGQAVTQGQEVAIMGNSGWASAGTHLHYNCYKNGNRVNPLEHTYLYPDQEVSESSKNSVMIYHEEPTTKFNIGDKVVINGNLYKDSNANEPSGKVTNKITYITLIANGSKHPYNTTDNLGWMNESDIKLYEESKDFKFNIGDKVIINGNLYSSSKSTKPSGNVSNKVTYITRVVKGTHPYNTTGDLGWMNESDIQLYEDKNTYIVKEGDTLSSIAAQYNMSWQKLYAKNKFVIGNDPNKIKPGQVLHI